MLASAQQLQVLAAAVILVSALTATGLSPTPAPVLADGPIAVTPSPTPPVLSAVERFYNPFGDPWALKRPPNPEVPVSLTTGCHRVEPMRSDPGPHPDLIQFVAKSNSRLVFEECAELSDVNDGKGAALVRPFITQLRAWDPSVTFIAYYAASVAPTPSLTHPPRVGDGEPLGLRYIDANQEGWFVHQKGKPPTKQYRLKHPSGDPSRGIFSDVLDVTNPHLRRYLANELVRSMSFHGAGGVMIDGCGDLPLYTNLVDGNVPPDDIVANWASGCTAFLADVKAADPSKLVFAIGYWSLRGQGRPDHDAYDVEWFTRRLAASDGLLWEDPMGPVGYPPSEVQVSLERLAARIAYARSQDKYLGIFVNTNIGNQSTFHTTTAAQQQAFWRYYFAAYLTVMEGSRTLLIPYTPTASFDQFHSVAYFSQWDLDVGRPAGPRQSLAPGVYRRDFERARVFVNGGTAPLGISLEDGFFTTPEGAPVRSATVPAKSGAIFMTALDTPACSPRPPVRTRTRALTGGAVEVQIEGGLGDVRRLEIGRAPNTLISVTGGPQQVAGNRTIEIPLGNRSTVMTLRQVSPNAGVFAQFTVVDSCGAWKTFAGRGSGGP